MTRDDSSKGRSLHDQKADKFQRLREKAERILDEAPPQAAQATSDAKRLLHELNVLHIELEMQHEELLDAQRGLECSRNDYVRLFDFAPVSYVILDRMGLLQDLNLNASDLLGARREYLVNKPFMTYVQGSSQQVFFQHRTKVFETGAPQTCELELALRQGRRATALVQSHLLCGDDGSPLNCLTALIDITELRETQDELSKAREVLSKEVDQRTAELFETNRKLEDYRKDLEQRVRERTGELEDANTDLRESEERWRTLFMTTPDAIILSTLDEGRLVDVNEGFCALSGYSAEEAVGKSSLELGIWLDSAERKAFARELLEQGRLHNRHTTFRHKDGTLIDTLVSARCIEMQSTRMVVMVTRDIRDLRRAEEKYRGIFNNSNLGIFRSTSKGRLLDVNPALARMLGFSSPQDMLQNVGDLARDLYVDPEQRNAILASLDNNEEGAAFEVDYRRKDGGKFTGRLHLRKVTGESEAESLLDGFVEDISERKRTEEALSQAEERYRKATEAGRTAVWEVDLQTGRIETEGLLELLLGLDTPMLTLRDLIVRIHPDDRDHCSKVWERCLHGLSTHYDVEPRMLHADGQVRWFSIQGTMIRDDSGTPRLATGTARDVTEQKRMELQLREAKERADAASQAKSAFLANMSHEIRTPLGSILGMTDLTLTTPLRDDQHKYLDLIKESATSLLQIINDLLDISRIEAGKLEIEQAPFSLRPLMDRTLAIFENQAREKRISLLLDVSAQTPESVTGDQGRLGQVLRNLLSNAIKFTEDGEVRLETRPLLDTRGRPRLLFTVRDSGLGIAPEDQEKLFKSFSQLEASLAHKTPGSGLGLAISKQLVEAMGGSIWLESELGKGSSFHFTITFNSCEQPECHVEEPVDRARPDRPLRILLAEDNPINAEYITHFLERDGHRVRHASTGAKAVDLWGQETFDIVLMDIQMHEMDGMEATRLIREQERTTGAHTPIIALTAYAMDADKDRFLQTGMDYCVTKPVDMDVLFEAIAEQVDEHPVPQKDDAGSSPADSNGDAQPSGVQHFDEEKAHRMVRGDKEITLLLRQKFVFEVAPQLLSQMREHLEAGDAENLRRSAHSLKGSAATICATRALDIAMALEEAGENGDLGTVPALLDDLAEELAILEGLVQRP